MKGAFDCRFSSATHSPTEVSRSAFLGWLTMDQKAPNDTAAGVHKQVRRHKTSGLPHARVRRDNP